MSARSYGSARRSKNLGHAQRRERLGPHLHGAGRPLLHEHDLPVFVAQADEIAVVVEVEKLLTRAPRLLTGQIRQLVVAVEVDLEGPAGRLVARQ